MTGKLKNGWYFCLYENDAVFPALCFDDDFDNYALKVTEVLAPCDFDHFVELTEKVKKLEKEVVKGDTIIGGLLNEGVLIKKENRQLRQLLKECKEKIHDEFINQDIVSIDNFHKLLTKINEVLK